jgi:hypothetical protein
MLFAASGHKPAANTIIPADKKASPKTSYGVDRRTLLFRKKRVPYGNGTFIDKK